MGQVIGATNARGEEPTVRAMDSNCLLATIYHRFGIDTNHHLHDRAGRPIPILAGGRADRGTAVESGFPPDRSNEHTAFAWVKSTPLGRLGNRTFRQSSRSITDQSSSVSVVRANSNSMVNRSWR